MLGGGLLADLDLYPFEHRYVELDGSVVHYIDEGVGPTLLFLHAAPAWSFIYRAFVVSLRGRFRCVALDFPGFGFSTAGDGFDYSLAAQATVVEQFVEALDLRGIVLMVHDSAGPIGLTAACRIPSRFRGLILSDTFAWSLRRYPHVTALLKLMSSPPLAFVFEHTGLLPWIVANVAPRGRRLSVPEKAGYSRAFDDQQSRRRVLDVFAALATDTVFLDALERELPKLRTLPALIMFGERDPIKRFRSRFELSFPNNRSIEIMGEGHFPHEGSPHVMIVAIDRFMDELLESA